METRIREPISSRAELAMLNMIAHTVAQDAAARGSSCATFRGFTLQARRYGSRKGGFVVLQVVRLNDLVASQLTTIRSLKEFRCFNA